ncbi:Peptidoglycan D,D-transpeptidase MrdA [hydrothermal vent metagenome]|uniref:Peptidoglycan D,D-transpeptidase MrdA n=1 Tax=hydrothermal vent metagenome TaxID=652676 RepID=A0A3B0YHR7_9ZZZZ
MASRITIKDYLFENRLFMQRSIQALIFVALLIAVLIGRLVYLQILAHEHYITLSDDNRIKILPEPPNRGLIFDRNGVILADNLPSYRLEITPEQIHEDMDGVVDRLATLINIRDIDRKRFDKLRKRTPVFKPVPLRFHLGDEEVARFAVDRHRFPGVEIVAGLSRHYPHGPLASHAIGYVGRIDERDLQRIDNSDYSGTTHIGKVGIERTYEERLHGTVGFRQVETNAEGRVLRTLIRTPPIPGDNLYLTLDLELQNVAEQAFGDRTGAAVAINPSTGEVLAFVSKPTYDPNLFVNGIDTEAYAQLRDDEMQPLFNRALRGQYPPGSTLKPFVGLGGLELGISSTTAHTFCPGYYQLPGKDRKYRDWKRRGHGTVDLKIAIAQSCDVYFYDLALSMGIDRLYAYLSKFGFGTRSGLDISGEMPGLMPSREWKRAARNQPWFPGETLITGIGQGFVLTTPVQLASATATLSKFGHRVKPHIVASTQSFDDPELSPVTVETVLDIPIENRHNWEAIIDAMREVVHGRRGTAHKIGLGAKYEFAGKTGTAQVFGLKEEEKYDAEKLARKLHDHSLFIAFAPIDNPSIAIAVVVEHGGSGSAVAAPIARTILDQYLSKPRS